MINLTPLQYNILIENIIIHNVMVRLGQSTDKPFLGEDLDIKEMIQFALEHDLVVFRKHKGEV